MGHWIFLFLAAALALEIYEASRISKIKNDIGPVTIIVIFNSIMLCIFAIFTTLSTGMGKYLFMFVLPFFPLLVLWSIGKKEIAKNLFLGLFIIRTLLLFPLKFSDNIRALEAESTLLFLWTTTAVLFARVIPQTNSPLIAYRRSRSFAFSIPLLFVDFSLIEISREGGDPTVIVYASVFLHLFYFFAFYGARNRIAEKKSSEVEDIVENLRSLLLAALLSLLVFVSGFKNLDTSSLWIYLVAVFVSTYIFLPKLDELANHMVGLITTPSKFIGNSLQKFVHATAKCTNLKCVEKILSQRIIDDLNAKGVRLLLMEKGLESYLLTTTGKRIKLEDTDKLFFNINGIKELTFDPKKEFNVAIPIQFSGKVIAIIVIKLPGSKLTLGQIEYLQKLAKVTSLVVTLVQAAENYHKAQKAMERNERFYALGRIAASVAHEIKNPINTISVAAQTLLKNHPDISEEILKSIIQESDRVAESVNKLLSLGKQEENPEISLISLEELFADLKKSLSPLIDSRGIELEIIGDISLTFQSDKRILRETLLNILLNAVDALEGHKDKRITISVQRSGHDLYIKVTNNGTIIPQNIADRIFEPFFTTKAQGSGLGLSVSKMMIEKLDGRLYLEKSDERETTFVIKLPRLTLIKPGKITS